MGREKKNSLKFGAPPNHGADPRFIFASVAPCEWFVPFGCISDFKASNDHLLNHSLMMNRNRTCLKRFNPTKDKNILQGRVM